MNVLRFVISEELYEGALDSLFHEIVDGITYLVFNVDLVDAKTINCRYFGVNLKI